MRVRSRWPGRVEVFRVAAGFALIVSVCASASGQLLDLGGPPGPGRCEHAGRVARELGAEADRLGGAGGERARAKAAWRRAAGVLLASASGDDGDSAERALIGWTMRARAGALDRAIDLADADGAWLSAVLFERLATETPESVGAVWNGVRDAVAPLGAGTEGPGWFVIRREGRAGRVPPGVARRLDAAAGAYASSAARAGRLLEESAAVLEPPGWVSDGAAGRLERAWREAAEGLFDPDLRDEAAAVLERLAAWGALLGVLDDGSRDAASVAARRAAVGAIVERPALLGGGGAWTDALRMLAELLRPIEIEESSLTTPLRAVWRRVRLDLLGSVRRQKEELGRVLRTDRPTTDPAVLALVGVLRRCRAAAEGVGAMNSLIAFDPDRPGSRRMRTGIDRRFDPVARRLIELARAANGEDADSRAARAALEDVLIWSGMNRRWPGEDALRAGSAEGGEIERIAGEDAASILDAIDGTRSAWLLAWAEGARDADLDAGIEARRGAMSLLADAALLAPALRGARTLRANAWPGFEMSPAALRAVAGSIGADAARAWKNPAAARALLEKQTPGRLVAAVERAVGSEPGAGGAVETRGPLSDLAAGAPIGGVCWGAGARGSIACVCVLAEEAGAGGDGFVESARVRASAALDALAR